MKRYIESKARPPKYAITHKPIEYVTCGAPCRGVLMRQTLSRIEESLGHEGFQCDACGRRVKYVPKDKDVSRQFARYAWIVDVDKQAFVGPDSDVGKIGPRHIHPIYKAHLEHAEYPLAVRRWRARDDDGELYYEGRYIGPDDHMFGPLEDFATPNAGATSIEYLNETTDTWEAL